ncbi:UNVERIFIED_CONTAM: hypothetical protein PYX00_008754 [Menopon gallinae]|uniref:ZNF380 coiled-coil domain-containing protein n=1 Tax=Menopon gallinae TaxID=328185 RepID=A0AAW2HQT4_9NEOP
MSSQTKKIKQDELRRLMNEQKKKLVSNVKRIESPLARYPFIMANMSVVRSEAVWSVHLNSKFHKENVAKRVKKQEEPCESKQNFKRPAPNPPLPFCEKRVKSILKNSTSTPTNTTPISTSTEISVDNQTSSLVTEYANSDGSHNSSDDFEEEEKEVTNKDVLPEGFFDDPKLDAKVRNVEYKDPVEEEWEQFQREIREETSKAQQIIADDQEEATAERQIEEIDEQIRNWNRVVSLERKKQEVIGTPVTPIQSIKQEDSSGEENDFEEFVDWRAKKSFE